MRGLYIHIPFCKSRCTYCGFYSTTMLEWRQRYVEALGREMEIRAGEAAPLSTIYLGGGTPSQLSGEQLLKLFAYINKVYDTSELQEVTIECNPDDVTTDFCQVLAQLPVNRVSMGVQTFSDERLRFLHRRHSAQQVSEAFQRLRAMGIGNISLDLMFGFPGETLAEWHDDIAQVLKLNPEHISAYALMYEEGTPLYEQWRKGKFEQVSDESSRLMYEHLIDSLEDAGYEHYEISNFARGRRSLHNSSYWNQTPYIGLGAAAHSFDGLTRSWNVSNLRQYVEAIEAGRRPFESETIDADTRYNDLVTTALRTKEGISLSSLTEKHRNYLMQNAERALTAGLLELSGDHIRLSRQGLFVSDDVMSDLIFV